ncbi:WecB/TagA/CpsF family glycosyltransferase [Winogradskyella vincentii]|uniref:WecB/TagA/CpsF family glycosyltransferase n=1 Tax=Winogradskyella vincentii TaxID=2877122 RepID=A0ABS7XW44_9FLAO|nr:WecB/TagA/CpsF family glycosyltransferase [Winogradskyella vincentii]MCA0151868.1 WecB/TagA/CpsF family glycosyltransferase [Winogradskyella vincentii]
MRSERLNNIMTYAPETREELIEYAFEHHKILVAVNAEKILHATEESRAVINRNLGYPDGFGAVWALRKKGHKTAVKIPGCELWLDLISANYKTKSFYLVGSKESVILTTVNKLKTDYPGITICNFKNGYLKTESEEHALIQDIKHKRPDVVFVAMGSPKQELLMERMQKEHQALYQGLGGSFDVYVGHVKRAPKWWISNNLEWAYRLLNQPARIKRQIHLIRFFINLTLDRY